mgnify:CR=1 FL=1
MSNVIPNGTPVTIITGRRPNGTLIGLAAKVSYTIGSSVTLMPARIHESSFAVARDDIKTSRTGALYYVSHK